MDSEEVYTGLKNAERLTVQLARELNETLLPKLVVTHRLKHFLNFSSFEDAVKCTYWAILRDQGSGAILGAACFDARDQNTLIFCPVEHAAALSELIENGSGRFDGPAGTRFDHMFSGLEKPVSLALGEALAARGHPFQSDISTDCFEKWILNAQSSDWQNAVESLKTPLPEGFFDDVLNMDDAELVNDLNTYKSTRSFRIVQDCIRARPTACVRYRDPQTGQINLVAWVLTRTDLAVSMLHVLAPYRRHRLGTRVVIRLILQLQQMRPHPALGLSPEERPLILGFIDKDNEASKKLHARLGMAQDAIWHRWIRQ